MQVNLAHCAAAHDLFTQTVRELKIDLAVVSEPYPHLYNQAWYMDASNKAVIWSCGNLPFEGDVSNEEAGFVGAQLKGIYFYSCYAPPSLRFDDFKTFLDRLVEDAKQHSPVAIAGDFNSWAVDWGSRETNQRGRALLEAMAILDVEDFLLGTYSLPWRVQ
mgnify:CR=1 FL=1